MKKPEDDWSDELTEENWREAANCKYTYVITSGYYNPLHIAHINYLEAAQELGDFHITIVNNDQQVKVKGSIPFMSQEERMAIVSCLECVDEVRLSIDEDESIAKTLEFIIRDLYRCDVNEVDVPSIRPNIIFANGGDRKSSNPRENHICNRYEVVRKFGVGGTEKKQSSSSLIENAAVEWCKRNNYIRIIPAI